MISLSLLDPHQKSFSISALSEMIIGFFPSVQCWLIVVKTRRFLMSKRFHFYSSFEEMISFISLHGLNSNINYQSNTALLVPAFRSSPFYLTELFIVQRLFGKPYHPHFPSSLPLTLEHLRGIKYIRSLPN